ncbi:MAG: hypothetical protein JXR78_02675, partial [Victivallales bacterium]|nr:hypothetical protein [Victivallales bacterium]
MALDKCIHNQGVNITCFLSGARLELHTAMHSNKMYQCLFDSPGISNLLAKFTDFVFHQFKNVHCPLYVA